MIRVHCDIIGVIGDGASGKDFVAERIADYGYIHVSASEILRETIRNRGLIPTRELQTSIANEVRLQHGGDYFVAEAHKRGLQHLQSERGLVMSGLYSRSEGLYIKRQLGRLAHVVIAPTDDINLRYERLRNRADGSRDVLDLKEFIQAHQRENSGTTENEANIASLAELADAQIINDDDPVFLRDQLDKFIGV